MSIDQLRDVKLITALITPFHEDGSINYDALPEYTFTVPASQTAAGSADIISHTFEQYFVSEGAMLSDGFCESMLRTVMKYAPIAIKDPTNFEARGELLAASSFGCCRLLAVGREAGAWPCHGIEHELS